MLKQDSKLRVTIEIDVAETLPEYAATPIGKENLELFLDDLFKVVMEQSTNDYIANRDVIIWEYHQMGLDGEKIHQQLMEYKRRDLLLCDELVKNIKVEIV